MTDTKTLTVSEFAEKAKVTEYTVRQWIKTGRINAEKKKFLGFSERWEIPETELKKIDK